MQVDLSNGSCLDVGEIAAEKWDHEALPKFSAVTQRTAAIQGRVVRANGLPYSGAPVCADRLTNHLFGESLRRVERANSKGEFRFEGVGPISYILEIDGNDGLRFESPNVRVAPGQTASEITIREKN